MRPGEIEIGPTFSNRIYDLYFTTNLVNPNWNEIMSAPGTEPTLIFPVTNAAAVGFYRPKVSFTR